MSRVDLLRIFINYNKFPEQYDRIVFNLISKQHISKAIDLTLHKYRYKK
jgi:hypothetical protein